MSVVTQLVKKESMMEMFPSPSKLLKRKWSKKKQSLSKKTYCKASSIQPVAAKVISRIFSVIDARRYLSPFWRNSQLTLRAEPVSAKSEKVFLPLALHTHDGNYRRTSTIVHKKVTEWCQANPGILLAKSWPIARSANRNARR